MGIKKLSIVSKLMQRNDISGIAAAIVLFIAFSVGTDSFLTPYNIYNVSRTAALFLFVTLGQVFVVITGEINLSIGQAGALSTVMCGFFFQNMHLPIWITILLTLSVGALTGVLNGLLVIKLNLTSFVSTLITGNIYAGLVNVITKGYPYTDIPEAFSFIGRGDFLGIPYVLMLMLLCAVFVWYFFKYTVLGRKMLARGGNVTAARLSGIKTDNMTLIAHIMSGLFAAIAAMLWVSRQGSASPQTGNDWMLVSFPIAVLGGTSLSGGEISAVGLVFASFLYTMIKNGLVMVNVDVYYESVFMGLILLFAVGFESFRLKYRKHKRI